MENDDYLQYLYDKKAIAFNKYKEIEEDNQKHDVRTENYKNYKNKINKLSNKLANINNSIFFYEQFLLKRQKNSVKREQELKSNLIQKFMKFLLVLNFSDFNSEPIEIYKQHEDNLLDLFNNLDNFPYNQNELSRIKNSGVQCLKFILNNNDTSENFLNLKYYKLKKSYNKN